ncbi:MAG: hypothetical protein ACPGYL_08560 [Rhodospirillaceae bacterium]
MPKTKPKQTAEQTEPRNSNQSSKPSKPTNLSNPTKPFSIRLTAAERDAVQERAGSKPLGEYIRACLFPDAPRTALKSKSRPFRAARSSQLTRIEDSKALAAGLARLGQSGIAASLQSLANAARLGALPVDGKTESALSKACQDITEIKRLLLTALRTGER